MPETSPLTSATNTGHARRRELLGDELQRLRLAGARRAGDQAVPVEHRERDADQRLGMALPVVDRRAQRHDGLGARSGKAARTAASTLASKAMPER